MGNIDGTDIFVVLGQVSLESEETIGVFTELVAAQERCDEQPENDEGRTFDRHQIEAWKIGALQPHTEWVRARGEEWNSIDIQSFGRP